MARHGEPLDLHAGFEEEDLAFGLSDVVANIGD
jgi:hypothetical protein